MVFVVPRNCPSSSTANWTRTILPPTITKHQLTSGIPDSRKCQGARKNVLFCFVFLVLVGSPEVSIVFVYSTLQKQPMFYQPLANNYVSLGERRKVTHGGIMCH